MTKTTADILDAAAALIEPEGAWTQGAFSLNADGSADYGEEDEDPIAAEHPVCWCALGAIAQVTGRDPLAFPTFANSAGTTDSAAAVSFLEGLLGCSVEAWNDREERTQAEVVSKLREAAARARGDAA